MKRTAAKAVSLLLVLCLSVCCFSACSQTIVVRFVDKNGNDLVFKPAVNTSVSASETASVNQPQTEIPSSATPANIDQPSTSSTNPMQPAVTDISATQQPTTQAPVTQAPATEVPITAASVTQPPATEPPATQPPAGFNYQPLNKKGDLYRADCTGKIWAKLVGSCYLLFKDIDAPNEWGEKGKVYELYVTYIRIGESYSMWSDGHWELSEDGTVLKLTPVNQGNNGNIGADVGSTKTFTADDGRFTIPVSFEQGGGTEVILDLRNALS